MTRRIHPESLEEHEARLRRFARRGYWYDMEEAGAEIGVTSRRARQLVEELRIRIRVEGNGRTARKSMRGCCVDAAKARIRCDVPHPEDEPERAAA